MSSGWLSDVFVEDKDKSLLTNMFLLKERGEGVS